MPYPLDKNVTFAVRGDRSVNYPFNEYAAKTDALCLAAF
jgi:hypothetical protein